MSFLVIHCRGIHFMLHFSIRCLIFFGLIASLYTPKFSLKLFTKLTKTIIFEMQLANVCISASGPQLIIANVHAITSHLIVSLNNLQSCPATSIIV